MSHVHLCHGTTRSSGERRVVGVLPDRLLSPLLLPRRCSIKSSSCSYKRPTFPRLRHPSCLLIETRDGDVGWRPRGRAGHCPPFSRSGAFSGRTCLGLVEAFACPAPPYYLLLHNSLRPHLSAPPTRSAIKEASRINILSIILIYVHLRYISTCPTEVPITILITARDGASAV